MIHPWDIKKEDFLHQGQLADKIRFVLGYAILAPSTHNSQPWLFKVKENSVEKLAKIAEKHYDQTT